jgi:hypothetical protein
MKLAYDVIEDAYDDTTQIRTMTEHARGPGGGWLIRTTVYSPHHISMNVMQVRPKKKSKSLSKWKTLGAAINAAAHTEIVTR